jgi:ribosome-binding protein aMBF1 (putative translation factor)
MLAVVKKPHIELSINGEGAKEAVDWLARKFRLQVISSGIKGVTGLKASKEAKDFAYVTGNEEKVNIEDTDFYREMEVNRSGNLLEAARLKAGLSQKQLADAAGIRQTMVSEFENGRRRITKAMAARFAKELKVKPERLM